MQKYRFKNIYLPNLLALFLGIAVALFLPGKKTWDEYYRRQLKDSPREFVVQALKLIAEPSSDQIAIELGSGIGKENLLLLKKGFQTIAIDKHQLAFEYMLQNPEFKSFKNRFRTEVSSFEDLNFRALPQANLILACFSLPFCKPQHFKKFWHSTVNQIKPNGYFVGNFFNPDFSMFSEKDRKIMTFHSKKEVIELFVDFKILYFKEVKEESTASGE